MENLIINVFKGEGVTSQTVVTAVKRALEVKTAGHCGTLDPLATGVLPVMINRAVKASEYLTDHDKCYRAKMRLGIVTDTGDITGTEISRYTGQLPDFSKVLEVLPRFMGEIIQVPPMYSALKVDGQKLVDLARKGIEVERKGRKITIYSLEAVELDGEIELSVVCSRGTYIRTLVEDIGASLGCGAVMSGLCRTAVGNVEEIEGESRFIPMFSAENAVTIDELKRGILPERSVTAVEKVYEKYPPLTFPAFYEKLFSNGCEIYIKKLSGMEEVKRSKVGDVYRIIGKEGFFALGEVFLYEDGLAIKQIKRF